MFVDQTGLATKSQYNHYSKTFTENDKKLTKDARYRLVDYKIKYANAGNNYQKTVAHKKANLLRSLDSKSQAHFGAKYTAKVAIGQGSVYTIDKINMYEGEITAASQHYNIPKAAIAAILYREITCYMPGEDAIGGASVGLGQINPNTFINAYERYYNTTYNGTGESVEALLKNDNAFSVGAVALILADIARQKGIDLNNCTETEMNSVLAQYNSTGDAAVRYGTQTGEYRKAYDEYYNG